MQFHGVFNGRNGYAVHKNTASTEPDNSDHQFFEECVCRLAHQGTHRNDQDGDAGLWRECSRLPEGRWGSCGKVFLTLPSGIKPRANANTPCSRFAAGEPASEPDVCVDEYPYAQPGKSSSVNTVACLQHDKLWAIENLFRQMWRPLGIPPTASIHRFPLPTNFRHQCCKVVLCPANTTTGVVFRPIKSIG